MRIFVQDQGMKKKFRGLFFLNNAEVGQKVHLWTDANSSLGLKK